MITTPVSEQAIKTAATCLKQGGLVAFPTETVYGLGAIATDNRAVARIFKAKKRPSFNPLISHFADRRQALGAGEATLIAEKLAAAFWPGPLTLILKRPVDSPISMLASAGTDSLAIRVPAHKVALALITEARAPIVAPSANLSGRLSPSTAIHVLQGLGEACDIILDGGACEKGLESTVIDCRTERGVLLRPGPITSEDIYKHTGIMVSPPLFDDIGMRDSDILVSPGQLPSHYAPKASVRMNAQTRNFDELFIAFGPAPLGIVEDFNLSEKADLVEAAARLFSILHAADKLAPKSIAFAPIPVAGLGLAINDRLSRAASPRPS